MRIPAVLLALTALGCSDSKPAPTPSASSTAPAGTVVDVRGTVTVAGRGLEIRDTVSQTDVIDTGSDGAITIELAHNHVRFDLGPNKHVKVNESLAWGAPMKQDGAEQGAATTSAGRAAERSAADTTTSAPARADEPPKPEPVIAPTESAPAPPATDTTSDAKKDRAPRTETAKSASSKSGGAAVGIKTGDGGGGLGLSGTGPGGGGLGSIGTIGKGGGGGTGTGYGAGKIGGASSASPPKVTSGSAEVNGSLPKEVVQRVIRRHSNEVRYCYERSLNANPTLAGRIVLSIVIDPNGAVVSAQPAGGTTLTDDSVVSCVVTRAKTWTFPAPDGGGTVTVTYPFTFASQ